MIRIPAQQLSSSHQYPLQLKIHSFKSKQTKTIELKFAEDLKAIIRDTFRVLQIHPNTI